MTDFLQINILFIDWRPYILHSFNQPFSIHCRRWLQLDFSITCWFSRWLRAGWKGFAWAGKRTQAGGLGDWPALYHWTTDADIFFYFNVIILLCFINESVVTGKQMLREWQSICYSNYFSKWLFQASVHYFLCVLSAAQLLPFCFFVYHCTKWSIWWVHSVCVSTKDLLVQTMLINMHTR